MIIPRPMGFVRSLFFYSSFTISRIPFWFIIISTFFYQYIQVNYGLILIFAIFLCRSYIESEIAGSGFFIFTSLRFFRFISFIFILLAFDLFFIYYALFASPIDKALISLSLIILIYLFYDRININNKYWQGYKLPIRVNFVITFLWLYLIFMKDNIFGNILILLAIYLIEFFHLINSYPLKGLEEIKNKTTL